MSGDGGQARKTRGSVLDGSLTHGTLMRMGSWWVIACESHVMIRLKRWMQKVDPHGSGEVRIRRTPEVAADLQTFTDRFPLEMTPEDRMELHRAAETFRGNARVVAQVLSGEYVPRTFEMAVPPRDYQRVAADLWLQRGSLILGDQLGLGKTISAITGLSDPSTRPALVVTGTHLLEQWKREVHRCLPGTVVHILQGTRPYDVVAKAAAEERAAGRNSGGRYPDVLVTAYSRLDGWGATLASSRKLRGLVLDEVQELRGGDTKKYAAAKAIRASVEKCIGLSATPIYNYGAEFHTVGDIVHPGALGTREEFLREWCVSGGEERKARVADPKAFGLYLREAGHMLVRTRGEVGRELPSLTVVPYHVDADLAALDKVKGRAGELAKTILRQRAGTTSNFDMMRASGEFERLVRQATGLAKAPAVAAFAEMVVGTGEKLLLFAWHREVWSILQAKLKDVGIVMFTGEESAREKQESFKAFCDPNGPMVLGMSLRAGSAGLDGLQHVCRTTAIAELDWSPKVHDQGIGRLHRDGQPDPVMAYFLLSDFGSDPVISDVCGAKRAQSEPIHDPLAKIVSAQTDPAHVRTLAERYLDSLHR